MKIERKQNTLRLSQWNKRHPLKVIVPLLLASCVFYFIHGLSAFIVALLFLSFALLVGRLLETLANYSHAIIDFESHSITSTKTFFGFTLSQREWKNIDPNKLAFKVYQRGSGGLKKYVLEYQDRGESTVVYRVDKLKHREEIEEEMGVLVGGQLLKSES